MTVVQRRPAARTWLLAAIELAAAVLVARLMLGAGQTPASTHASHLDHGMAGMPGMSNAVAPTAQWGWVEVTAIGMVAAALTWWLLLRQSVAAVLAAAGLVVLATSPAVRVLAARSHLVAMMALESLLVIAPLLVLAAHPRPENRSGGSSRTATVAAVATALLYAGLLMFIHLPAVHARSASLGSVPLWVPVVALVIGIAYWSTVLGFAGRVSTRIRLATLIGAQEVAAFIGLLSLFGAWGTMAPMAHINPLGISMAWDQRVGGALMLATCAVVTIPITRRISR